MMLQMYSIYDSKAEVYNTPFFSKTHGEAERSFKTLTNDPKSQVNQYPEDFDLYHIGEYDDNKGITKSLDTPKHILKAISVLRKEAEAPSQIAQLPDNRTGLESLTQ